MTWNEPVQRANKIRSKSADVDKRNQAINQNSNYETNRTASNASSVALAALMGAALWHARLRDERRIGDALRKILCCVGKVLACG
jgi:hypothetical protein